MSYRELHIFEIENGWLIDETIPSDSHNMKPERHKTIFYPSIDYLVKGIEKELGE